MWRGNLRRWYIQGAFLYGNIHDSHNPLRRWQYVDGTTVGVSLVGNTIHKCYGWTGTRTEWYFKISNPSWMFILPVFEEIATCCDHPEGRMHYESSGEEGKDPILLLSEINSGRKASQYEFNYLHKACKIDGGSKKYRSFKDYKQALQYCRTDDIQRSNCHYVIYEVYLRNKLVYTIQARRKSPVELPKEEEDAPDAGPVPQLKLKLISGGMDGFGKDNWLEPLPEGTVFQCVRKGGEFICLQFHIKRKWKKSCHLFSNFPVHQTGDMIAHYQNFASKHDLLEVQRFGSDWVRENEDAGRRDEEGESKN